MDKHIDNEELNALVSPSPEGEQQLHGLSADAVREAERHVKSCRDCSGKVSKYRQLVNRSSNVVVSEAARPGADCPNDRDVNWHEVAAGLWPELKAKQPDSPGRKAAGRAEDAVAAGFHPSTCAASATITSAVHAVVGPSASVDGDCRCVGYATAVITHTTLWAEVCRIRR